MYIYLHMCIYVWIMEVGVGIMEGPPEVLMENDGRWPYGEETDGRWETMERELRAPITTI